MKKVALYSSSNRRTPADTPESPATADAAEQAAGGNLPAPPAPKDGRARRF